MEKRQRGGGTLTVQYRTQLHEINHESREQGQTHDTTNLGLGNRYGWTPVAYSVCNRYPQLIANITIQACHRFIHWCGYGLEPRRAKHGLVFPLVEEVLMGQQLTTRLGFCPPLPRVQTGVHATFFSFFNSIVPPPGHNTRIMHLIKLSAYPDGWMPGRRGGALGAPDFQSASLDGWRVTFVTVLADPRYKH